MAEPGSAPTAGITVGNTVRVAVRLDPRPRDLGEWLADAAAFEAAGAEALWVDPTDDDPLVLVGALAVVTSRALLLTGLSEPIPALNTAGRLSRGRLRLITTDGGTISEASHSGQDDSGQNDSGQNDSGQNDVGRGEDGPLLWLVAAGPENRAAWQASIADAVERGFSRVVVPANARLLDILRNPGEPGDRLDLHLAMG